MARGLSWLPAFSPAASGEKRHRICLTHWRKSKGKRSWDILQQARREGRELEERTMQELLELLRLEPYNPIRKKSRSSTGC
jgi:hypothetical protein